MPVSLDDAQSGEILSDKHSPYKKSPDTPSTNESQVSESAELNEKWYRAGVWRAGELKQQPGNPTGFPVLDGLLPFNGWPQAALTEILSSALGLGALRIVLPSIAKLSQAEKWIIWVCPPHIPYVPALETYGVELQRLLVIEPEEGVTPDNDYKLWVFEQALRFQDCGAALVWLDSVPQMQLRRLQLACEAGQTAGMVFRPETFTTHSSPATLRLLVTTNASEQSDNNLNLHIIKCRGQVRERSCHIDTSI